MSLTKDWVKYMVDGLKAATLVLMMSAACSFAAAQPYIATSQNYYCAESGDAVSLYCNVLAFDPNTNVADWSFTWSPASEVSDANAQTVTVTPDNTTDYSVVMVAPDGTVYEDDITITVYPVFTVLTDPVVAMCSTVGGQLEASVDVANAMNWQWAPATGLSNATISDPQIQQEISQTYTVTATIAGLGGASCSASAQVDVVSIFPSMELGLDIIACSEEVVLLDPGLPVNYVYDWTVPGETLPVLEVTETGTYGLTATSPEGCENSDAITVTFTDGPEVVLPDSATGCADAGLTLDATPIDLSTGPFSYQWSNGSNAADATFFESTLAQVQVTDAGGCTTTTAVELEVLPSPEFAFPEDSALCFEDFPGVLHQLSVPAGYAEYAWMDGSTSPSLQIDGPGVYSVVVTNEIGCTTERFVTVVDFCSEPLLFVPTAFTPDGDGLNEVLRIEGRNLVQLDFKLYNRWGNLVWEADSLGDYWHGQGPAKTHYVQDELYLWKAKYRHYTDPSGQLSPWFQATGSVRIIR
jgi:gliding motility-associated-like protein